jgi:hypothetical protein
MTARATITALHKETEDLLTTFGDSQNDTCKAVDLISRCRLTLSLARDDGLGPWESPELEYALHIASRHNLPKLALICACEVLMLSEHSLATISDHGFLALLA